MTTQDEVLDFWFAGDPTTHRKEWFEKMREAWFVLWWVPRGHRPTIAEAAAKLELLRAKGPTQDAFNFRRAFLAPDAAQPSAPFEFGDECPAI